jgi:type IV pilus assembly protein PilM
MAIGLDIGTSAVRAAQVRVRRGDAITVTRCGEVRLPPGVVGDGEIHGTEEVVAALRRLWSEFRLRERTVALGLAGQHVVVRQLDMPALTEDELRDALPFQAADHIPIPVEEALLDYVPVETYMAGEQELQRLLLVAAERAAVDAVVDAVTAARLRPALLDLEAFALIRSLAGEDAVVTGETEAFVDIGATVTTVVVHTGGSPRFVRMMPVGGASITRGLQEKLGLEAAEAEALKIRTGLRAEPTLEPGSDAERVLEQQGQRLVMEVRRSLDFFRSQHPEHPVVRAVLSGGGSLLTNLPRRLEAALDLPVEHGRPLGRLGAEAGEVPGMPPGTGPTEVEPYFAVALGLALGLLE